MPDFGHSLGDGYIVVLYPEDLAGEEIAALPDFVTSDEEVARAVLAGPHTESTTEVKAITIEQTMTARTCTSARCSSSPPPGSSS